MEIYMRIAICDDLASERKTLINFVRRLESEENIEFDIVQYDSAEKMLETRDLSRPAEILFLDIYMHGMNGNEAAKKLIEQGYQGSIVFCTTSHEHAVEAFRLKADGYLVKPYDYESFSEAIWRCRQKFEKAKKALTFISDRFEYNIPLKEIAFIETDARCCVVHTLKEQIRTYKKMKDFEESVKNEPSFLKITRSCIINMNALKNIRDIELVFKNNEKILLPERSKKLQQQINDYFWKAAWSEAGQ